MSDAFWMALFGFLATLVTQWSATNRAKRTEQKLDHNIELSNSMLSKTVAKKESAEHKLEQSNAETLAELKAKLAEKEATIALITKVPGTDAKESADVRPFRPEVKEGGLDRL